jgi:hypothetical protein
VGVNRRLVGPLIALIAAALIVTGVTVIYWPAGLITAGLLLLAALFGPNVE